MEQSRHVKSSAVRAMVRVQRNQRGARQDYRHAPESMNMKPSRFSEMAHAATLNFLQEEVMVRLKEERVGKKSKQQREGKKSKLDHFLRNRDEPKVNWKRSIKEDESFSCGIETSQKRIGIDRSKSTRAWSLS
jgi:hypothetical protein